MMSEELRFNVGDKVKHADGQSVVVKAGKLKVVLDDGSAWTQQGEEWGFAGKNTIARVMLGMKCLTHVMEAK